MITIDGAKGEGGGQVLRTALGLALVSGKAFRIGRIRAKRRKPGLLRQHLTAVQAAAAVGQASVEGASLGSMELTFKPGTIRSGEFTFAVGTAGSATLVLQTVLPALMLATAPSTLFLEGGTHNPMAPPFDFLEKTFLPVLNRMGPRVTAVLERPGFYPAGGGRFRVTMEPTTRLRPIQLLERGEIRAKRARIVVAHLGREIGQNQKQLLRAKLNWPEESLTIVGANESRGPGNVVMAEIESANICELFTGFGARGVSSGKIIHGLVEDIREYLSGKAPVGEHLADQLMIPFALAGGGCYRATKASPHARTNKEVIERFLSTSIELEECEGKEIVFRFGEGGERGP